MQVARLLSAFEKTSPAETRSNNSGRYNLLKAHIPWVYVQFLNHLTPICQWYMCIDLNHLHSYMPVLYVHRSKPFTFLCASGICA